MYCTPCTPAKPGTDYNVRYTFVDLYCSKSEQSQSLFFSVDLPKSKKKKKCFLKIMSGERVIPVWRSDGRVVDLQEDGHGGGGSAGGDGGGGWIDISAALRGDLEGKRE